ncbi:MULTISPECIES: GNAT family N-acetyltransferase [unclassified Rhizobium]|uniref:GNAT family N-acetyltransferase n=1 Tax=unclassified Rhizobium TaxID=2613769 RepID=UPI001AEB264C|nr:CelD/BcsL family acetyltransferase involved in cellulose biosynthesis [Rhizobium sp. PvP014]MBP2528492.1 CelD/BcsL family acetyltransferase involved in cellulose biosynthesis [Rhizobium sp. PvP099]
MDISSAPEPDAGIYRRLSTLAEIDTVADAWRALESRCEDRLTYFQSFDWCRGWVAAFAGDGSAFEFRIETVWRNGSLVAVWPLMVQTVSGIRVLENLGAPHSQYCNLLCDDAHLAGLLMGKLLTRIEMMPDCDVAVFHPVPHQSSLGLLLRSQPTIRGYGGSSAVLDLTQFADSDAYRSHGGKLKKRNRNRRRNHLARLGELTFEMIWPSDQRFAEYVRDCAAMKRVWLRETGRSSSGFSFDGLDDFLASLTGDAALLEGACLSILRAGDVTVAMELGFVRAGHYYAYLGSFDWSLRHLSAGKVQMEMTVCWLIDNGIKTYDLLGGDGAYKQSWANQKLVLNGYSLPFSWKGRLYAQAWLPVIRPFAKRVYFTIPESWRRFVSGIQGVGLLVLGI